MKKMYITLIIILLFLLVVFGGCIFFSIDNPKFDFISTISGLASFFIAILTVLYVYTTSKQLEIMTHQFEEIRTDRIFREQPILNFEEEQFIIYRPKFYYTPPQDQYSFQSVYSYCANLKNLSSYPAICVDVTAELIIPKDKGSLVLETNTKRFNIISSNNSVKIHININGDTIAKLYEAIRLPLAKDLPRIQVIITYKNITGGSFHCKKTNILAPNKDDEKLIRTWHTCIVGAPVEAKEAIELMKRAPKGEAWRKVFEASQKVFDIQLGDEKEIRIKCIDIPDKFELQLINSEKYKELTKNHSFSQYIHKRANCNKD